MPARKGIDPGGILFWSNQRGNAMVVEQDDKNNDSRSVFVVPSCQVTIQKTRKQFPEDSVALYIHLFTFLYRTRSCAAVSQNNDLGTEDKPPSYEMHSNMDRGGPAFILVIGNDGLWKLKRQQTAVKNCECSIQRAANRRHSR
jgi:hypothetical protein